MKPLDRIDIIQTFITKLWIEYYPQVDYFQFVEKLKYLIDCTREDFSDYPDYELEAALKKILDGEHTYDRLKEFNDFCS